MIAPSGTLVELQPKFSTIGLYRECPGPGYQMGFDMFDDVYRLWKA